MGSLVKGAGTVFGATNTLGLSSAAALAGDYMQYQGQRDTNSVNKEIAESTNRFNSAEAARNRQFQSEMFDKSTELDNTAVQRRVADLRAAGLNPALAYMQGGAQTPSTPSGSSASGVAARMENPGAAFGRLGEQALAAISTANQLRVSDAQISNVDADTDRRKAEADEIRARTPTYGVNMDKMRQDINESIERTKVYSSQRSLNLASADKAAQEIVNMQATLDQIDASIQQMQSIVKLNDAQIKNLAAQTGKSYAEIKEIQQRVSADLPHVERAQIQARTTLDKLKQPEAMNNAGLHNTWLGSMSTLLRAFNPLAGFIAVSK